MTTVTQVVGTRTSLAYSGSALSALANATYVQNTTAYDCTANDPQDVAIEVAAQVGSAPSGNKQLVVFIRESLDGTNYRSGPTSGTTTTDEPDLLWLGNVPILSTAAQRVTFSLFKALGYVPASFFVVIKNETGQTLSAGTVFTSEISQVF